MIGTIARLTAVIILWPAVAVAGDLPNPKLTPGAFNPALTAAQLCAKGYHTSDVRNVSAATRRLVFKLYGMPDCHRSCEVDHLVSLELGGLNTVVNLWPQAYAGDWGARKKDGLENRLHSLVCKGRINLHDAQTEIRTNWKASWTKHFQGIRKKKGKLK